MHVGENVRNTTVTIANVQKQHVTSDRTRLLAESAAGLLDRMERLHALDAAGTVAGGLEGSAMCQWVVDLTYRVVKCAYVGIAQVRDGARAVDPLAEAGHPTGDRRAWWAHVQKALYAERAEHVADASLIEVPLDVGPPQQITSARHTQHRRAACAVPIRSRGKLTAIFAVEAQSSASAPLAEIGTLARAMARLAAMTLEAVAFRPRRGVREAIVPHSAGDEMDGVLGWVSHELKSPLTTIMGCLQLVGPKVEQLAHQIPKSAEVAKTLSSIQERLALASRYAEIEDRLATDLVDAARTRSAQMTLHPRLCDLGLIIREAVDSQRIGSSRCEIHLEVPDRDIPVSADPDRIAQVVANLLGNALKYSPEDTPVEVCVEMLKTSARVSVRDSGPGIEKSDLTRVWQRFYRVSGGPAHSDSATGSGLGLGLYIARDIVRRHKGKVGVTSVPGHGATFSFTLPLATTA